jgi:hypothetical protein
VKRKPAIYSLSPGLQTEGFDLSNPSFQAHPATSLTELKHLYSTFINKSKTDASLSCAFADLILRSIPYFLGQLFHIE